MRRIAAPLLAFSVSACGLLAKNTDDERTNAEFMAPDTVKRAGMVELVAVFARGSNGEPLEYHWSLDALPPGSQTSLLADGEQSTRFMADVLGIYQVTLVVDDGAHESAPVTQTVEAVNTPPEAVVVSDAPRTVELGQVIQLDASMSTDCDGDPLSYRWYFDHVPRGSNAEISDPAAVRPTFIPDLPGLYAPRVVVSDGMDESEPHGIFVSAGTNTPPTAVAGEDRQVAIGEVVVLDGSASSDPDPSDDNLAFAWRLVDKPTASQADLSGADRVTAQLVPDSAGEYTIELVVQDEKDVYSQPDLVTITAR